MSNDGCEPRIKVFDKLDGQAVKVILAAEEESRRAGLKHLDTAQLLLGLLTPGVSARTAKVINEVGLNASKIRQKISKMYAAETEFVGVEVPFTDDVNRTLECALAVAEAEGKDKIGTEHILQGLAEAFSGGAEKIFTEYGVSAEKFRELIKLA